MAISTRQVKNKRDSNGILTGRPGTVYDVNIKYIPLFFKHNIFGVRAGIQYTPSCDDHILAWDFTF